jgi:hypothetical protein
MNIISEQNETIASNKFGSEGQRNHSIRKTLYFYKYCLKCSLCSWNVSYSEPSGSLDVSDKSILCPVCKDGKINSLKYPHYR